MGPGGRGFTRARNVPCSDPDAHLGATAKPPGRKDPVERPPAKYKRGEVVYAPCVQKFGQKPFPAMQREYRQGKCIILLQATPEIVCTKNAKMAMEEAKGETSASARDTWK